MRIISDEILLHPSASPAEDHLDTDQYRLPFLRPSTYPRPGKSEGPQSSRHFRLQSYKRAGSVLRAGLIAFLL